MDASLHVIGIVVVVGLEGMRARVHRGTGWLHLYLTSIGSFLLHSKQCFNYLEHITLLYFFYYCFLPFFVVLLFCAMIEENTM
jgi:hypothetical protein